MRVVVVGHVEWVEFVRVARAPEPGAIVQASECWAEPAGGGAVAAVQLAELAGSATLYTALGDDSLGHRAHRELQALGLRVEAVFRPEPQRRAVVFVDDEGERTITLLSPKLRPRRSDPLPWDELAEADAAYFTGGDPDALRAAREARVVVATARELPTLIEAEVRLDALVRSASDQAESYRVELEPPPSLVVSTAGSAGGTFAPAGEPARRFRAVSLTHPVVDAYGAGDRFAAGLTFALAAGREVEAALELAAACGAGGLYHRGAYGPASE